MNQPNEQKSVLVFCTNKEADLNNFITEISIIGFTYDFGKVPSTNFREVKVTVDPKTSSFVLELANKNKLDMIDAYPVFKKEKSPVQKFLEFQKLSEYVQHLVKARTYVTYFDLLQMQESKTFYAIATTQLPDGTIACYGQSLLRDENPSPKQLTEVQLDFETLRTEIERLCPLMEVRPGILTNKAPFYLN